MDNNEFLRKCCAVDPVLLQKLVDILPSLPDTTIPRFSYRVRGTVMNQVPELDQLVYQLHDSLAGIPELKGNPWNRYYAIHWADSGSRVREHNDISNGHSFNDLWQRKWHVPLVTNPDAYFTFRRNLDEDPVIERAEKGYLYLFNNVVFHGVVNNGPPRAHLVMYSDSEKTAAYFRGTKLWDANLHKP